MGTNRKRTERIRDNKTKPNKENLKKDEKRVQKNRALLKELASA